MTARLFIAIPVPDHVTQELEQAMQYYPQYIEKLIPKSRWHLTLFFLGEVKNYPWYLGRLTKNLPQQFLPAVTITHVGRGLHRGQLWAYAHRANVLDNVRTQISQRVSKLRIPMLQGAKRKRERFIPHINLAKLHPASRGVGMADFPVVTTFTARQAVIYRSDLGPKGPNYTKEGIINLVP